MRLCFGAFMRVLMCHQPDITQARLGARIARCLDEHSNYISSDDRYKQGWEIEGDGFAISKLCNCKRNFLFANDDISGKVVPDKVPENFKAGISLLFNEDSKIMVILTLLNIVQNDSSLDSEQKENFKKYLGVSKRQLLQQKKFVFSDLLGRILLYIVYGGVNNTGGKEEVESITNNYIKKVTTPHIKKYVWEPATESLTLNFGLMFNIFDYAIQIFQVDDFLKRVDPVNTMREGWIEMCQDFNEYVERNIWERFAPTALETPELMLQKIQQFSQMLDEYISYLCINMRPLLVDVEDENPEIMVPISYVDSRDELYFGKKVSDYRNRICSIYQDIYSCAILTQ